MQNKDIETCDFVFDRKKHITPKSLQRFKANIQNEKQDKKQVLDDDVFSWLLSQDTNTKTIVNDILRSFMISKTTFLH